ncbi:MAG: DNA gyrase inhibitor YacG [Gammaproteobacteria bacterium]|jgi:endogenous inhibitor of DNA gyrase (YacG/DUF329 family)|nr:DNA gyrase inhibitor YacG [Gammaproteobacteria bacterium]|tara:strand:- start:515 stop:721 length:207 start_codon:yes stop_codon:yes gene_type:complete
MTTKAHCPNCKIEVVWNAAAKWRPFCSERCRLIDLGEWFNENNRIAGNSLFEQPPPSDWPDDEDWSGR